MSSLTFNLEDVASVRTGDGAPQDSKAFCDKGVPFIRAGSLSSLLSGKTENELEKISHSEVKGRRMTIFPAGTVVFAKSGMSCTKGLVYQLKGDCCVVNHLAAIECGPDLDSCFLLRWLEKNSPSRLIANASYPSIKISTIRDDIVKLPFKNGTPDLDEQKRIAAILDKADAIRRKRRQALQLTDDFLRSLFLDMFGDPVTNPKGWTMGTLGDLVERLDGGKNIAESNTPTSFRVLKVSAVTSGKYRADQSKFVPDNFQVPSAYIVKAGDLLVSRANTRELIGATAYVWDTPKNIMLPDKIWKFVWRDPKAADPLFVHALTRVPGVQAEIGKRASGTSGSMKNIAKPKLLGLPIPIPSTNDQRRFGDIARRIQKMSHRTVNADVSPNTLFSSLQHGAFKGEL